MMGTRSGVFFVGSKESGGDDKGKEFKVGFGLRTQQSDMEPSTHKRLMLMSHHHDPPSQLSSSSSSCSSSSSPSSCGGLFSGGLGDGSGGLMFCNTSNFVACLDMFDVVGTASASGANEAQVAAGSQSLGLFDSHSSSFSFNPSGEMVPSVEMMRMPFTAAQLRELERQTMIFKYLMASAPVPPELLINIQKCQMDTLSSQSNSNALYFALNTDLLSISYLLYIEDNQLLISYCECAFLTIVDYLLVVRGSLELGVSGNSDPEPWRCKRTDGKKWRCSRDVAPDQKYCERHSHKSRPRSRKPVESHPDYVQTNTNKSSSTSPLLNQTSNSLSQTNLNMFPGAMPSATNSSYDQSRSLEWFSRGEIMPDACNSNKEWHLLRRDRIKCDGEVYNSQHCREEQLDSLNSGVNLRDVFQVQRPNDSYSLSSRHFIDDWRTKLMENSSEMGKKMYVSSNEKIPLSSLTLSIPGISEANQYSENAQIGGFGFMRSDRADVGVMRPQWTNHGSWMSSPPGGPLAEALGHGISGSENATPNSSPPGVNRN